MVGITVRSKKSNLYFPMEVDRTTDEKKKNQTRNHSLYIVSLTAAPLSFKFFETYSLTHAQAELENDKDVSDIVRHFFGAIMFAKTFGSLTTPESKLFLKL